MLEYVTTHDDPGGALTRWLLDGATRDNTDHGRAYVRLTESGGDYTVSLFSDPARTQLVAQGTSTGASGPVSLDEQNSSGLSGGLQLREATPFDATIDIFYADDADVTALQKEVASFLVDGAFADRLGFASPLAQAKRVMDALLNARHPEGWRADSLEPLADATARYALFFIYEYLSTRPDDPASQLAAHWRQQARLALPHIRISLAGELATPFVPRIQRS